MSFQTPITIANAIENIEHNRFLLPSIQREFVWSNTQIEWLFDSIMRNYPIGSFLFWQVEGTTKNNYKYYSFLKQYREKYNTHNLEFNTHGANDFIAILDGQQRLAALYIGLKGSYAYKLPRLWWENTEYSIPTRHLYLNIKNKLKDEEDGRIYDFKFLTESEFHTGNEKWFRVGEVLNLKNIFEFNKYLDGHNYKSNKFTYETLSRLQEAIHSDKIINYFLEKEQNLDKALNIFIRVNSGGEALNFSDLLLSIAIANWTQKDARKEINQLIDEIRDKGFFILKDFIMKTFLVLYSNDIRFKVTNFSKANAVLFENEWENIKLSIHSTFDLIKSYGFTEKTLTSKNALIPIIYYLYHKNIYKDFDKKKTYEKDRQLIKKWLHIVLIRRVFGGQADAILSKVRSVFTTNVSKNKIKDEVDNFPYEVIAKVLKGTTKDMTFDEEYIEKLLLTQKDDSLSFSILAILYPHLDYANGNFHKDHIFAATLFNKSKLRNYGINNDQYDFYLNQENNNSILNLQFLDANENESKKAKELKDWIRKESKNKGLSQKEFCDRHIIPEILEFNDFPAFISARKKMLKAKLNKLV